MTFVEAVGADLIRYTGRADRRALVRCLVLERAFPANVTLRLAQRWPGRAVTLLHLWACNRAGIHLASRNVGEALLLNHPWGLVVGPDVVLGSNVTLYNGVTIGQKDGRSPVIDDEVWVGAHAVIAGGVTVGHGAIVGPGAIVMDDVAAGTVVVGNPARVIREDVEPDVLNRWG